MYLITLLQIRVHASDLMYWQFRHRQLLHKHTRIEPSSSIQATSYCRVSPVTPPNVGMKSIETRNEEAHALDSKPFLCQYSLGIHHLILCRERSMSSPKSEYSKHISCVDFVACIHHRTVVASKGEGRYSHKCTLTRLCAAQRYGAKITVTPNIKGACCLSAIVDY